MCQTMDPRSFNSLDDFQRDEYLPLSLYVEIDLGF